MAPQHVDTKSSHRLEIYVELKGEHHSIWDISGSEIVEIFRKHSHKVVQWLEDEFGEKTEAEQN